MGPRHGVGGHVKVRSNRLVDLIVVGARLPSRPGRRLGGVWNLVERWSAEPPTNGCLEGTHHSVKDLVASIRTSTPSNDNPKPLVWDTTADEILDSHADILPADL
ncbi:MAG: hypothetical protein M3137_18925 [Actinomycetota bacterium]|nr:hypothetical protein [Actinomycetota bacterium]